MCVFPCQIQWLTQSTEREKKGTERHQEMLYNAGGCTKYKCELVPMNLSTACSLCRPTNSLKITEEKSIYLKNMNDESSTMSNLFDEGRSVMTVEKKKRQTKRCWLCAHAETVFNM